MVLADLRAYFSHLKYASKIMITQHEYVAGCFAWYKEADLQPGNPEDGVWHEAHYPIPKCLGGTEVTLLLEEHHAVQGVLQSEEFQHPCIWRWEKRFLGGEALELWRKWMAIKAQPAIESWKEIPFEVKQSAGRKGTLNQSREDKVKGGKSAIEKTSYEEKLRRMTLLKASMTPEKEALRRQKATESTLLRNPDHFSDMGRRARDLEPLEVKQKRIQKCLDPQVHARALSTINSRKFKCLVTGFTSTAGPLSRYQKARGIDTSLREPVHKDKDQTKSNGEN